MKNTTTKLIIAFIIIFLLKGVLVSFIPAPSSFSDGYVYAKTARSFFFSQELSVHEEVLIKYPPLYSMALSISYLFNDMNNVYLLMKLINTFLSSLIIFPAFFLANEFLSSKKSFLFSVLISVLPQNFSFSAYLMSENLFYTLFLTSIYFIYKSFKEDKINYDIIASIFIGMSYLTRVISLVLPITVAIFILINLIKKEYDLRKVFIKSVSYIIPFSLIIFPWIVRNLILFGDSSNIAISYYNPSFITSLNYEFVIWIILYIGFVILGSGILFMFIV